MKTKLLITCALLFAGMNLFSQDTLVGWTFPSTTLSDTIADLGIAVNRTKAIHLESDSMIMIITKTKFSPPASAQAMGMSNATSEEKGWYIEFEATHYSDLKVFSRQQACPMHSGPKYWKIQYKLDSGSWTDVPNGSIVCDITWAKARVSALPLPADCNNASNLELRWITTSDSNIAGPPSGTPLVTDSSMTRIDDIIITGTYFTDISPNFTDQIFEVFPNPGTGYFNILTDSKLKDLTIYNSFGQLLYADKIYGSVQLDLSKFGKGLFVVKLQSDLYSLTEKLIIQ